MELTVYFQGDGLPGDGRTPLPPVITAGLDDPAGYRATPGVRAAVNVALNLGLPLLVTGEPGTGKSQLARAVAYELRLPLIEFVAKSSTSASDLLYRFDAVRHFRDAQLQALRGWSSERSRAAEGEQNAADCMAPYIRFEALGKAIALTYDRDDPGLKRVWDDEANRPEARNPEETAPLLPFVQGNHEPARSIVLIDELDKAPRDVPNDLLVELNRNSFRIPEAGVRLSVQNDLHPIVMITSNSEKSLPDAFLRRCVFHHIEFPTNEELEQIILARIPKLNKGPTRAGIFGKSGGGEPHNMARSAIRILRWLRPDSTDDRAPLRKPPSVGELLSWLVLLLRMNIPPDTDLCKSFRDAKAVEDLTDTLGVLVKDRADRERVVSGDLRASLVQ